MADSTHSQANDIPFRGTGKATDFHDIQDYQEETGVGDAVLDFSKENPLTAVVSVFGLGLIVGASAAVAMSYSRQQSSQNYLSSNYLKRMWNDTASKASPSHLKDIFRG